MRMCAAQSRLRIPADAIKSIGLSEMEKSLLLCRYRAQCDLAGFGEVGEDVTDARFAWFERSFDPFQAHIECDHL